MTTDLNNKTPLSAIPEVPDNIDPAVAAVLEALKENLEVFKAERPNADALDGVITKRDLIKAGIVNLIEGDQILSYEDDDGTDEDIGIVAKGEGQGVYGIPTPPTGLNVTGTAFNFILEWDEPDYNGHWRTEVWRSATNDIGDAVYIGTSRSLVFLDPVGVTNSTRYYWIRHVNLAGKVGPFHAGTQQGEQASTGLVNDDDLDTIAADKIVAASLSAITANLGTITAGLMQSSDGTMQIDLNNKEIAISGPGGLDSDDYVIMTSGKLEFWKWTGATHQLLKSVTNRQSGVANSGDTVTIPSYFDSQPEIILTPRTLQTFSAANSGQDQSIELKAENITEYATGQWQFDAVARLILSGNNGSTVVNYSSGEISSNTHTSSVQTTPANTTDFTVNITVSSVRSTGTSPNYYNRKVDWRVGYKPNGSGGGYTYTGYQTVSIGDQLDSKTDNMAITGLSADSYDFIVEYIAADEGGTFSAGGTAYEFAEDTKSYTTPAVFANAFQSGENGYPSNYTESDTNSVDLGSYSVPAGWEVYNVDYDYNYSYEFSFDQTGGTNLGVNFSGSHARVKNHKNNTIENRTIGSGDSTSSISEGDTSNFNNASLSQDSYDRNFQIKTQIKISGNGFGTLEVNSTAYIKNVTATIQRRKPTSTSTTPENEFKLDSYDYTLSGSSSIASGSLSWVALGK